MNSDNNLFNEVDKILNATQNNSKTETKIQAKVTKKETLYTVEEMALTLKGKNDDDPEYMVWIVVSTNSDGKKGVRIEGGYPLEAWADIAKFIQSLKK